MFKKAWYGKASGSWPRRISLGRVVLLAIGAIIPLLPWFFSEGDGAVMASALLGLVAAAAVGAVLARFTERSTLRTVVRQVGWAVGACAATWLIGSWLGAAVV